MGGTCSIGPVKRGNTASIAASVGRTSLSAITFPSRSSVSVSVPNCTVNAYSFAESSIRPHSLVASPSAIGSTPSASGSSVPPWPTLTLPYPASRCFGWPAPPGGVEPSPTGLSRMIQPLIVKSLPCGEARQRHVMAYRPFDRRRDDGAHRVEPGDQRGQDDQEDDGDRKAQRPQLLVS